VRPKNHPKQCRDCGEVKPLDEFYKDSRKADGKTTRCKECCKKSNNAYSAKRRAENPEWNKEYLAQWRLDHLERYPIYRQTWREANEQRFHDLRFIWRYNITLDGYYDLLIGQNEGCGICGIKEPYGKSMEFFNVDHDHSCCDSIKSCGKCVRGLLCTYCNATVLPSFEKLGRTPKMEFANEVAAYLEAYRVRRELLDAQ
jgi:hypothetical protein